MTDFSTSFKQNSTQPNGLVISSNVDLKELLEDITVILHNMAFNRFISEEDLDPQYNRHPYQVDWNITRDNRFTCSQAYMVYIWDQRFSI